ncbi:MAG: CBS domain-containing protein [Cyanobacteria bacterium P01_D01_bin.156]
MDLIICHTNADWDTFGAALGIACLRPKGRIVVPGKLHQAIKSFLAQHHADPPLIEQQQVPLSILRSLTLVDCHQHSCLGIGTAWMEHAIAAQLPITIYSKHTDLSADLPGHHHIEAVGATTTLVVESLQENASKLSPTQATVMALGIHQGTGSLALINTTSRDIHALAWLLEAGANQTIISEALTLEASTIHQNLLSAEDLMSSPVKTIRPDTTVTDAQRLFLRYGHSGLCVVSNTNKFQGIISQRDIDLAVHHGFTDATVQGYITLDIKTIEPKTPLHEIQSLMVIYDIARLPVLDKGELVGIVTRSDVLRQVSSAKTTKDTHLNDSTTTVYGRLETSLRAHQTVLSAQNLWTLLNQIATAAHQQGWHLYVVGGAVRDLLLASDDTVAPLKDIDLVVDSFHSPVVDGAGVVLAQKVQQEYPDAELRIHGAFKTATLSWRAEPGQPPLIIDIATARTEFYPYPAANPEVEPSSIQQDLYRRDFTINAMALRLTEPISGLLLDFFGGTVDIQQRQVRVLHANSFIEDPTRIFRAVRFAVRLDFVMAPQTETFIRYAIHSGIYTRLQAEDKPLPALQTRLKAELSYLFQADYWSKALAMLDKFGALSCLHPSLALAPELWRQIHRVGYWQQRFIKDLNHREMEPPTWLIRLEVLLAQVEERAQIAINLQLPQHSIQRLQKLANTENTLLTKLQHKSSNSFIYQSLIAYDLPTLLLVSVRHPKRIGTYVWHYITQLAHIQCPIDGHALQRLGYCPGPLYRTILAALTYAALDGHITSSESAETYLEQHYPLT